MWIYHYLEGEDENNYFVRYSVDSNKFCDGLVVFDKKEHKIVRVIRKSLGENDIVLNWVAKGLRATLKRYNTIPFEKTVSAFY